MAITVLGPGRETTMNKIKAVVTFIKVEAEVASSIASIGWSGDRNAWRRGKSAIKGEMGIVVEPEAAAHQSGPNWLIGSTTSTCKAEHCQAHNIH